MKTMKLRKSTAEYAEKMVEKLNKKWYTIEESYCIEITDSYARIWDSGSEIICNTKKQIDSWIRDINKIMKKV